LVQRGKPPWGKTLRVPGETPQKGPKPRFKGPDVLTKPLKKKTVKGPETSGRRKPKPVSRGPLGGKTQAEYVRSVQPYDPKRSEPY
jgi:hypothetical protein